jgi:hypothetical protein
VLWALFTSACVSAGGQSGTEALDVKGESDAATVTDGSPTEPTDLDDVDAALPPTDPETDPVTEPQSNDAAVAPLPNADAAVGPDSLVVELDYYQEPCGVSLDSMFCIRGKQGTEEEYGTDRVYTWSDYAWGHHYRLLAHWQDVAIASPDGPTQELIVDQVLEDTQVEVGTQFTLTFDPTLEIWQDELITYDLTTDTAQFANGPAIGCELAACSEMNSAKYAATVFEATFEFDADANITMVGVNTLPEVETELERWLASQRSQWEALAPTQYVLKICNTGFNTPGCTLAAVEAGVVMAAEQRAFNGEWMATTLAAEPISGMFDAASSAFELELDDDYNYLSSYTQRNLSESWGERVTCFVPDSADLEVCRDVE